jgi:hypothetical protein
VYQNISRANFSAERGMRYGQDYYDDRMQASSRVSIEAGPERPTFTITRPSPNPTPEDESTLPKSQKSVFPRDSASPSQSTTESEPTTSTEKSHPAATKDEADEATEKTPPKKAVVSKTDPIRWFGLITPSSLKMAQSQATKALQETVPRLVQLDAEMREVEIQVRRARKYLVKAQAGEGKVVGVKNKKGNNGVGGGGSVKEGHST